MADVGALIFDFDGVLLESEYAGNRHLAELLTDLGHPTSVEVALDRFVGLNGQPFIDAIERHIGCAVPTDFVERRRAEARRMLADGVPAIAGAPEFVRALPASLPKAIASSSSAGWMRGHLDHLGLAESFGDHLYSGHEHVARGKPAPDLYLHAARRLGVDITRCVVIEDSRVGAIGAVASGAWVIGLTAGGHCRDGHGAMLRDAGVNNVAGSFEEVTAILARA